MNIKKNQRKRKSEPILSREGNQKNQRNEKRKESEKKIRDGRRVIMSHSRYNQNSLRKLKKSTKGVEKTEC